MHLRVADGRCRRGRLACADCMVCSFDVPSSGRVHCSRNGARRSHEAVVPETRSPGRRGAAEPGTTVPGASLSARPRPALRASTIACGRFSTSSLAKMLVMWLRTVFSLSCSAAAICALSRPCAMSSSTSRSRAVSARARGRSVGASALPRNSRTSSTQRGQTALAARAGGGCRCRSGTKRACGIPLAISRPSSKGTRRSPVECSTSVGHCTCGSSSATSMSSNSRKNARRVGGRGRHPLPVR